MPHAYIYIGMYDSTFTAHEINMFDMSDWYNPIQEICVYYMSNLNLSSSDVKYF